MNALKHGGRARGTPLPGEDMVKPHELLEGLLDALKPANAAERQLVERLRDMHVRLARIDRAEEADAQRELGRRLSSAPEVLQHELIGRALVAVEALHATAAKPPPTLAALSFFITGARASVDMAEHVERLTGHELDGLAEMKAKVEVLTHDASPADPKKLRDLVPTANLLARALTRAQNAAKEAIQAAEQTESVLVEAQPSRAKRLLNSYRTQLLKQMESLLSIYAQLTALRSPA